MAKSKTSTAPTNDDTDPLDGVRIEAYKTARRHLNTIIKEGRYYSPDYIAAFRDMREAFKELIGPEAQ